MFTLTSVIVSESSCLSFMLLFSAKFCVLLCKGFVNSKQYRSSRVVDDDYSYYNDYEVMKVRRRGRQNAGWPPRRRGHGWRSAADAVHAPHRYMCILLSTVSALLLISTVKTIEWQLHCPSAIAYYTYLSEYLLADRR